MLKRWICGFLTLCLLAYAAPAAHAQKPDKALKEQIEEEYERAEKDSGLESLKGFCGILAGWQLYYAGINSWHQSADGNDYYDLYRDLETTTGGCSIKTYSAEDYTLEQALNAITAHGSRDAEHILAGFQWTSTEAGADCGHVVYIYAIKNGMVYCTETFSTSLGTKTGKLMCVSIADFADYYESWTVFEGAVDFDKKSPLQKCTEYPTNCFVEVTEPANLIGDLRRGTADRMAAPGERLWATRLYEDPQGVFFYEVTENGRSYYISGEKTEFLFCKEPDVQLEAQGKGPFGTYGTLTTDRSSLSKLRLELFNSRGKRVYTNSMLAETQVLNLNSPDMQEIIRKAPRAESLLGILTVSQRNSIVKNGKRLTVEQTVQYTPTMRTVLMLKEAAPSQGWFYEKGNWFYYCQGKPQSGWLLENDLYYYLDPRGAALTGEQVLEGRTYTFSSTGVLIG